MRQSKWFFTVSVCALILLTLVSRICIAYFLATDAPGDGAIYSQIAKNILEQNVYSLKPEAPFEPTLIRLPGQPLFIAAVYTLFGHGSDTAVRLVQALVDTATCVFAALIAFLWTKDDGRRRRNALWTFILISLCPFMVIYTATLLTETSAAFLMTATTLTATFAFRSKIFKRQILWWCLTGLLAGTAVLLRPDSGLFAAGIGLTLVVSDLFIHAKTSLKFIKRLMNVIWKGAVFSLMFIVMLAPWTVRNYRVFGVFQPLAPAHAEMPGEFVPHGYERWLQTWVDDSRFIEPTLWKLGEKPLKVTQIPAQTFDSAEERGRVAGLLEQYNHPPGSENPADSTHSQSEDSAGSTDSGDDQSDDSTDEGADANDGKDNQSDNTDDSGNGEDQSADDDDDENKTYTVKMTPEIDAGFAVIADERISRSPVRFYLFLPAKRAAALWLDSHSLYYPFGGQLSPVADLDYDVNQQYWLPLFTFLMWFYTLSAIGGTVFLWRNRADKDTLRWLFLSALMILPRIGFFSTVENPEPRYVVELFVFASILGGIFFGSLSFKKTQNRQISDSQILPTRLLALDIFRGITIAAMVLVNSPGTWTAIYPPLEHADWNGTTPADFIFPFFLFIVGVSITFALGKQVETANINRKIYLKIFKRSFIIFTLGLFLQVFPFYNIWKAEWFEPSTVRLMGVLQRIAVCYFVSALIFLHTGWKRQAVIIAVILLGYWALMTLVNVPGCEISSINDKFCNLSAYFDRLILTENHIWNQSKIYDPEGFLSTIPAIATTLTGVLTGHWLRSKKEDSEKVAGIFFSGVVLTAAGWVWSFWLPLNKSLWTSSYVVFTAGLALCLLGVCFFSADIKGWQKWAKPFVIFGTNALALYIGSSIMAAILNLVELEALHDQTISLQEKIFKYCFLPYAAPLDASLLYAVTFNLIWLFLMWLLYRKRIFIKI